MTPPGSRSKRSRQRARSVVKRVLPAITRRWLRERQRHVNEFPGLDWAKLCSLRRVDPIRRDFGWQAGPTICRYYIDAFLTLYSSDVGGQVLEIGEDTYTRRFGGDRVVRSDVLHVRPGAPGATIIADLTSAVHIPADSFDCIIMTQTLQFIYDTRAAIRTLYRILRPRGVLLATFPGISQIARHDMENWGEYWRFTTLSARMLFAEVFPEDCVTVRAYGNVLAAIAFLHGIVSAELNGDELDCHDPDYEVLITSRVMKPGGRQGDQGGRPSKR
jgi:SAM-dependent methyltransferase